MILYRRALVVDVDAAIVVLLPALRLRFRSGRFQVLVELPATGLPFLKLRGEFGVFGNRAQLRIERFDLLAFDWKDVAIVLALLEAYRDARRANIQFMVNGKGDQSVSITPQSGAISSFGRFIGPCTMRSYPGSVRNRQRTWNVKMPRMKWLIAGAGASAFRADLDHSTPLAAIPGCRECGRTQDLPAGGIGDIERQAAIGEALIGRLHPRALNRGGANIDVVALRQVSDQFQMRFLWILRVAVDPPAHKLSRCSASTR